MRELKFRVFASDDLFPEGKMYYPETMKEIDENRGFVLNQFGDLIHTRYSGGESRSLNYMIWARIGFNVEDIMQFTGMKDKNGKEIYEGDIISYLSGGNGHISKVWFDEECGCYLVENPTTMLLDHAKRHAEVICNIYENPELITNV